MRRTHNNIAALVLCALFTAAAAPAWPQNAPNAETLRQIDRLTERARANPGDAAYIVPAIVTLARTHDVEVRKRAADSLTYIARRDPAAASAAFSALATMMNDPDQDMQYEILRGLALIGDMHDTLKPQAITLLGLMAAAPANTRYIRVNAFIMLAGLPRDDSALAAQVRDIIVPLLADPDPAIRTRVAQTMWAVHGGLPLAGRTGAAAALAPLRNDPDDDVRADADRYIRLILCDKPNLNDCLRP